MIMIAEVLFSLMMIYITAGFSVYLYAAIQNYQMVEKWVFKIERTHIGIVKYPKWLLWWMYRIGVMTNGHSKRK